MFQVIGLFLAIPFVLVSDWFVFLKGLEPRERELTRASHGVAMILIVAFAWHKNLIVLVPFEYRTDTSAAAAFVVAWGLSWVILGAGRSRFGYRDGRLIGRAIVKVGLGLGLYFWLLPQWHLTEWWEVLVYDAAVAVSFWCVVTGATKFVLLMRPPPRLPPPASAEDPPYGGAEFGSGSGLNR